MKTLRIISLIVVLMLTTAVGVQAADFIFNVPVELHNITPGLASRLSVVCVVESGTRAGDYLGRGFTRINVGPSGDYMGTIVVQINADAGRNVSDAKKYICQMSENERDRLSACPTCDADHRTAPGSRYNVSVIGGIR